jgi:cytoskeletal protein RodZ
MQLTATVGRVAAVLAAGLATAWLIAACGSLATTKATQAGQSASTAVAQFVSSSTSPDPSPTTTTPTTTETRTVTVPTQTVTRTETVKAAPTTTSVANKTTSVQVTPATTTSTTGKSTASQIPWWGWLLIGLGAAGLVVAIFAAGHRRGARGSGGSNVSGGPAPGPSAGPPNLT